jgi:ATP-dependent DNA helicase DinG
MDDQQNLTALGIASYEAALRSVDGFRERPGQRAMVVAVARAFAAAGVGDDSEQPSRAIAVIQAGTGVGKSAAYITAGIAVAKAQKKRLVLSTSTTSLQEQLVSKDLPALAAAATEPFTYALAKGRGRYVCKLKLMRRAGVDAASQDTLELENESSLPQQATVTDSRVVFYRSLADALQTGWDGDRDSLPEGTQAEAWGTVAADRHTCTARACSHYSSCSYYLARRKLAGVDLIVANHDLVLASIGARTLPELEDAYWVFDEGHHLGEKAVEQFASSMDLTRLRWLEKLPRALASVASELQVPIKIDLDRVCHELKATLADMSRIVWDAFASEMNGRDSSRRLSDTEVESFLGEPLRLVSAHANDLSALAVTLGDELRARMKEEPGSNARWSALYVAVGSYAPRITETQHAADMLLSEEEEARTTAKWCSAEVNGSYIGLQLQACPILPGDLLRYHVWPRIRGAVVTSATLQSCGSWDYVLSELGLENDPAVSVKEVASPFDYAKQGRLIVRKTRAMPRSLTAYNAEVCQLLAGEIEVLEKGGLALFTSRRHMQQAFDAVPEALRERVLVQGSMSKRALIAEHRQRVAAGEPSIIFGLASFGEGLDLPGDLCEHLLVTKLPFAPPSSPVAETRAEYVESIGGDPFADLVVPAAGVRMLQWTGRGIRTEEDTARITCFDSRLTEKDFGRRILNGLPPYRLEVQRAC